MPAIKALPVQVDAIVNPLSIEGSTFGERFQAEQIEFAGCLYYIAHGQQVAAQPELQLTLFGSVPCFDPGRFDMYFAFVMPASCHLHSQPVGGAQTDREYPVFQATAIAVVGRCAGEQYPRQAG